MEQDNFNDERQDQQPENAETRPEAVSGQGTGEEVKLSKAEYEKLTAALSEAEVLKDKLLRSAADFENAKKRLVKEKEDFVKFCQEGLIRELLPVLDNFERAMAHSDTEDAKQLKSIVTGIERVFKQMSEALKNAGLKRIESLGKVFDPHKHEAIAHAEEEGKEDEIIDEIEPGYMLHDRLLRAAKVRVRIAPQGKKRKGADGEKQEEIT